MYIHIMMLWFLYLCSKSYIGLNQTANIHHIFKGCSLNLQQQQTSNMCEECSLNWMTNERLGHYALDHLWFRPYYILKSIEKDSLILIHWLQLLLIIFYDQLIGKKCFLSNYTEWPYFISYLLCLLKRLLTLDLI